MTLFRKVLLSCLVAGVQGHGRLTKPLSRKGDLGYENGPVTGDDFVCRHASRNTQVPYTKVTAGSPLTLQWQYGAAHVGDCAVYMSYDVASARSAQKYFKIANLPNCKDQNGQDVTITIPDFLPAGNAILRWDWYALHVSPSIEFYAQCVDIQITSTSTVQVSQLTTYSIINPAVYPANGQTGVGFRNPFNANTEQFMTGPACAHGYTGNNCALTAVGTTGNTRSGGAALTGGGTSSTSSTAATTSSTSTTSTAVSTTTHDGTTTVADTTITTTVTTTECVSHATLKCINDASSFWPRCDPSQSKSDNFPTLHDRTPSDYGHFCTQEWADALNAMLSHPVVNKCGDRDSQIKLLAEVAVETGYFTTLFQPADGGAGLVHMIPNNWPINAGDMESLFGGNFVNDQAVAGADFFQTPANGWLSVAAWYKLTNRVITGCGSDLFEQPFDVQTQCIFGQPNDRTEALNIVSQCFGSTPTTTPAAATTTTTTTTTVGSATTATTTSLTVAVCSGAPCSDVTHCRSKWEYCGSSPWHCNGESTWKIDGCGPISPGCSGAACRDSTMCRSRWGYCGSSSLYCNDMSTWKANGCTQNRFSALSLVNGTNSSYANSDGTVLSKASSSFSGIITSLVLMCILFSM